MTDWIRLNPEQVSKEARQVKRQNGVEITLTLSPYDVPDAVRGAFDSSLKRFVIEFSYIAEEPWEKRVQDQFVALRIGKNSGRIYGIEIDVVAMQASVIGLKMQLPKIVNKAIDKELRTDGKKRHRQKNYEIAKSVISSERNDLFGELAAV